LINLSTQTNLTPFEVWSVYTSMCLHFKKGSSYDAFKFNFKGPRLKKETFMSHKNRYDFEKLARAYPKKNDLILYFLANILAEATWINKMNKDCYDQWSAQIQSLQYRFKNDMNIIHSQCCTFDELFASKTSGDFPLIYKLYQTETICLDTLVILEHLIQYTSTISAMISDPLGIISDINHKIIKYKPFLHSEMNVEKYKNIVLNLFTTVNK
jgi:hypothetical protein